MHIYIYIYIIYYILYKDIYLYNIHVYVHVYIKVNYTITRIHEKTVRPDLSPQINKLLLWRITYY